MRLWLLTHPARSTTLVEKWCSRENRWTQRKNDETNRFIPIPTNEASINVKSEIPVRRNLLIKSDDLIMKILKICSDSNVQEIPNYSLLKKNQRVRYFRENNIKSENDFIMHIFDLCKKNLVNIIEQYRNGNNVNYNNIVDALNSLDKYKKYLNLDENSKTYKSYNYVLYLLNNLQKLENLRFGL